MKKRLTALILAVMLLLAAAAHAEAGGLAGTWYLSTVGMGGSVIPASTMGMDMTMQLNEDGTAHLELMGEPQDGTWQAEDGNAVVTVDDTAVTFVYADGIRVGRLTGELAVRRSSQALILLEKVGEDKYTHESVYRFLLHIFLGFHSLTYPSEPFKLKG